ncbi:alpha-amylase [Streptomyces caeruleatus]|nr:alpha-amylase [Streptomyces caeruleatus]
MRSTFIALAMALCATTTGAAASAAPQAASPRASASSTQSPTTAPDCVHLTVDWRYTFASNDCSSTYTFRVVYLDGTDVPCRTAAPGALITFPGRGTQGNEVLGAVLCDGEGDT